MSENEFTEYQNNENINEPQQTQTEQQAQTEQPIQQAQTEQPVQQPQTERPTQPTSGTYQSGYYYTEPQTGYNSWRSAPYDEPVKKIKEKKVKEKKDKGKRRTGLVAGVIAAALVVGLGGGFAGSLLANGVGTGRFELPNSSITESSAPENVNTTNSVPQLESSPATAQPLDQDKIGDTSNEQLLSASELYAKVRTTVAVVYKYTNVQGYDEPVKSALASGVVFTSDGYIITNAHVVSGAAKMTAVIFDSYDSDSSHEYQAEVIGADSASDLAVIKITRDEPFDYAKLGNSDAVRVGQDICVIGNPVNNSLASTLTKGIVSGLQRGSATGSAYSCKSIQIDAAVNGGNSGGGLFDMYGNVIGIIDYKISYAVDGSAVENIGFAITINEAKPIIEDLMSLGYVSNRPGLGINGEMLGDYAAYMYGYPSNGLRVSYIDESMPVAKSGLRVGDVIIEINGIDVTSMEVIQTETANHNIGDTVELKVLRASNIGNISEKTLTVELAELKLDT